MSSNALPSWDVLTKHAVFPSGNHDEVARLNFLTHLNVHLSNQILPGVKTAYDKQVKPAIIAQTGSEPTSRHDVRKHMLNNGYFQMWSALRRNTMEMRHQAARSQVLGQIENIVEKVDKACEGNANIQLDSSVSIPPNVGSVDIHCQPGCYYQEYFENDVTVAASYDLGLFVTTAGLLGALSDGGGQGIANWLKTQHPDFSPKRILDIGCTVGHNALPLAQHFPDAQVIAVDVARPSLRYAHARAASLGIENIQFVQANAEELSQYDDGSFDLITTSMFLHELSHQSLPKILKTIHRLLADGGLNLHLEQPQYAGMDVYQQFIRDWDTYFNNEPYWGPMHELDLAKVFAECGFDPNDLFDVGVVSKVDEKIFGKPKSDGEDYGRSPVWNAIGLWKGQSANNGAKKSAKNSAKKNANMSENAA
ncbi:MAG: SAM-dependent methyltransferase [Alteromonadaceae bacterium]|uniref:class I SAM-dependent methyltransferase n=1 Tax=Paraglaciecola chathamensis TaxID=368405 RepID=UPI000C4C499E|nr:methyltransferase domain-containing protein [Paraglaciecola agarilytica]MBN25012.1 SAM-dependent methyltransferase [Alteromonadaceae bacterium]|tara:strand:- start:8961 stop:10226 length:1266 start_codon:yes stop_codon:yes gene_type:complete